ncbi:MAG: hypothetical protein ACYDD1_12435 [Caulobacteraceae bacterium]
MSEMVEPVAKALELFFSAGDKCLGEHVDAARAAIAEMREPTAGMIQVAYADTGKHPAGAWLLMMDEALR